MMGKRKAESEKRRRWRSTKAPFPWFGGKARVAEIVWSALGDVDNYVEPFAGSLAVLLGRPPQHDRKAETVNDKDAYLANFWRALQADPEAVAHWCDWPVNETDLIARHLWLVNEGRERLARMDADPDFCDYKVAGWWVWGLNAWIGSGWCSGRGPWIARDGQCVKRQRPHLGTAGQGVNRQLPHLGDAGRGVNRQLPHLGNAGQGVNRQLPHLGNGHAYSQRKRPERLLGYFSALADRLRRVRVCCGDWARVVTRGATSYGKTVGILLDPPYSAQVRQPDLYSSDDGQIAAAVRDWAAEQGADPRLRIVLCGYKGEHAIPRDWTEIAYSASVAYCTTRNAGTTNGNNGNRHKERLWLSPGCRKVPAAAEDAPRRALP